MIELTRRALLKSMIALAAWAGLGPLQSLARPTVPIQSQAFCFPLTFSAAFVETELDMQHYLPFVING